MLIIPRLAQEFPIQTKPAKAQSVSIEFNKFRGKDGQVLNPADFLQFVVEGNSMQFCGIHDKDLIFVAKEFRIVQLKTFPYILVLKNCDAKEGQSMYKVRRAWGLAQFGDDRFETSVRKIMNSEEFREIKSLKGSDGNHAYRGDEQVIDDFLSNRLPKYEKKYIECDNPDNWNRTVVISTTFDTEDKFIHFSIHPISTIVGIVSDSFTVCSDKAKYNND